MRVRGVLILLLLLTRLAPTASAAAAPAAGVPRWFAETGHTLAYAFGLFWEQHGGVPILGYPLSEVFVEDGRPVQYFERTRLEWHAELGQVLAGQFGRWAAQEYANHPAFAPVGGATQMQQDYFAETGHTLGGSFQQFWHSRGGLAVFGFPLSEEFQATNKGDGRAYTVQYFERARFEWHLEQPPPQRVQLGQLGREYLELVRPAPAWALAPVSGPERAWDGVRPTRVSLSRLGLDTSIVEGGFSLGRWDVPRYSAVHYWPVAGVPGTRSNIVIAGHGGYRDALFNHLPAVAIGDVVVVFVDQVEHTYQVSEIWTVLPGDTWVMAPTVVETLTLITCVPLGVYSHRLIVRATPIVSSQENP